MISPEVSGSIILLQKTFKILSDKKLNDYYLGGGHFPCYSIFKTVVFIIFDSSVLGGKPVKVGYCPATVIALELPIPTHWESHCPAKGGMRRRK